MKIIKYIHRIGIHTIEYVADGRWYLTFGRKSPWDNFHVRVPKLIALHFCG